MRSIHQRWLRNSMQLVGLLLFHFSFLAHGDETRDREAALRLWETFLETYRDIGYAPKPEKDLDLLVCKELIAVMGVKYRNIKPGDFADLPELITILQKRSGQTSFALMELALTTALPKLDRFGSYESVAQMQQMEQAALQSGGGVYAMDILSEANGLLACYPDADGPAAKAGVLTGAILLEVDGELMRGQSLAHAKIAFVGGEKVQIKVLQPQGKEELIQIVRTKEAFPDVSAEMIAGTLRLRIRKFSAGSAKLARDAIKKHPEASRLTINLRGNTGGLLSEALLMCSLFLPKGTILSYELMAGKKKGEELAKIDDNGVFAESKSIGIIMDRTTASGAEVFAACLKHHLPEKVRLFGEKSYGKSYRITEMQIDGAGILAISDGLLMDPGKKPWHDGISPD